MQIHEITKLQRTDEGLLDGMKDAIQQKATSVYNTKKQSVKDAFGKVKAAPGQAKKATKDYAGQVGKDYNQAAAGEENPFLAKIAGTKGAVGSTTNRVKDAYNNFADTQQQKGWNKDQDKINREAHKAALALKRKGFDVDTTTPMAGAPDIKAQAAQRENDRNAVLNDLEKQFEKEFVNVPVAAQNEKPIKVKLGKGEYTKDNTGVWRNTMGTEITRPQSIDALNKAADNPKGYQVNPDAAAKHAAQQAANQGPDQQYGVNPGAAKIWAAQKAARQNATKVPAIPPNDAKHAAQKQIKEDSEAFKKNVETDFEPWIISKIPGLSSLLVRSPKMKTALDQTISNLEANVKNPKAQISTFTQFANNALAAVQQVRQQEQDNTREQGLLASQLYSTGVDPRIVTALKDTLDTKHEKITNTDTGSRTMDKILQTISK